MKKCYETVLHGPLAWICNLIPQQVLVPSITTPDASESELALYQCVIRERRSKSCSNDATFVKFFNATTGNSPVARENFSVENNVFCAQNFIMIHQLFLLYRRECYRCLIMNHLLINCANSVLLPLGKPHTKHRGSNQKHNEFHSKGTYNLHRLQLMLVVRFTVARGTRSGHQLSKAEEPTHAPESPRSGVKFGCAEKEGLRTMMTPNPWTPPTRLLRRCEVSVDFVSKRTKDSHTVVPCKGWIAGCCVVRTLQGDRLSPSTAPKDATLHVGKGIMKFQMGILSNHHESGISETSPVTGRIGHLVVAANGHPISGPLCPTLRQDCAPIWCILPWPTIPITH
ncbi:hypothetical protein C8R47DRAFT_1203128 [Mycena vitilis]|nr:hypothetical protein C8R47DRAFT_1203128 [Mycena vitilis]